MERKETRAIILTVLLFLFGNLMMFIGFSRGDEAASVLSRPIGADSWTVTEGMVMGCTYVPVIFGISLIILSVIFSTVLFLKWINGTR